MRMKSEFGGQSFLHSILHINNRNVFHLAEPHKKWAKHLCDNMDITEIRN